MSAFIETCYVLHSMLLEAEVGTTGNIGSTSCQGWVTQLPDAVSILPGGRGQLGTTESELMRPVVQERCRC